MKLHKLPNLKPSISVFGSRDYKTAREFYETAMNVWVNNQTEENWTRYMMAHLYMLQTIQQLKTRALIVFSLIIVVAIFLKFA